MKNYFNKSNMNLYELSLNRLFFVVDKLRNGRIMKELNSLEHFYGSRQIEQRQKDRFNIFLNDIKENVSYYESSIKKTLDQFPVITKKEIYDNSEKFISNKYTMDELIKVTTSGSYGTPMKFYRSKPKQLRQTAEVLYFGEEISYFIGRNHSFIRGVSKNKLKLLLQNEVHIDPTHLDDDSLKEIVSKVKRTKFIIGFPSVILAIIKYCEKKGISSEIFNLLGIISTSEPLNEKQRSTIKSFFDCPVIARYATEELGIIANQCLQSENYHVNEASFIVEVLDKESANHVDIGEEGRIVVTDLYSDAMPLIRYDTGDYGIIKNGCSCGYRGKVLKTISGRLIQNILDSDGNEVSPFSINVKMKGYSDVYQFQFIQEDYNKYNLLLVTNGQFEKEKDMLQEMRKILGQTANINIKRVEEIAPLPSGKRPYIINKLNS